MPRLFLVSLPTLSSRLHGPKDRTGSHNRPSVPHRTARSSRPRPKCNGPYRATCHVAASRGCLARPPGARHASPTCGSGWSVKNYTTVASPRSTPNVIERVALFIDLIFEVDNKVRKLGWHLLTQPFAIRFIVEMALGGDDRSRPKSRIDFRLHLISSFYRRVR